MSQLAYNYKGQRFAPPSEAMFWRVRRIRDGQRGQLDIVRGNDGRPLIVPIDIGIDAFRATVGDQPGRYRLDALDEREMLLADVDSAYVMVPMLAPPRVEVDAPGGGEAAEVGVDAAGPLRNGAPPVAWMPPATVTAPFGTWPALPMPVAMTGTEYLLAEALRGQVQMFQMVTAALSSQTASTSAGASQMMGAAAGLVRAADGAAMPHRPPPPVPPAPAPTSPPAPVAPTVVYAAPVARNAAEARSGDWDDEDPDDDEGDDDAGEDGAEGAGGEADMFAKILALADKVQGVIAPVADVARLVMGGMGGGVRNAAPVEVAPEAPEAEDGDDEGDREADEMAHLRASHILLISHELGADGSLFRRLLMAMEPADRHALTEHLCSMPFEEAVADAAAKLEPVKRRRASREANRARGCAREEVVVAEAEERPVGASRGQGPVGESHDGGQDDGRDVDPGDTDPDDTDLDDHDEGATVDERQDQDGEHDVELDDDQDGKDADPDNTLQADAPQAENRDRGPATQITADLHTPVARVATAPTSLTTPRARPTSQAVAEVGAAPAVQARMMEIAKHLRVSEILQAQTLVNQIVGPEREAMLTKLMALPPVEAAQVVRAELVRRAGR